MGIQRSTLRQAIAGAAANTAGVPGAPQPPDLRPGGEGEAAHDQRRHDRSVAGSRAKNQPGQGLTAASKDTQLGAAARALTRIQRIQSPELSGSPRINRRVVG